MAIAVELKDVAPRSFIEGALHVPPTLAKHILEMCAAAIQFFLEEPEAAVEVARVREVLIQEHNLTQDQIRAINLSVRQIGEQRGGKDVLLSLQAIIRQKLAELQEYS